MTVENYVPFLNANAMPVAPAMHSEPVVVHDHRTDESDGPTRVNPPGGMVGERGGSTTSIAGRAEDAVHEARWCGGSPATPAAEVDGDGIHNAEQPVGKPSQVRAASSFAVARLQKPALPRVSRVGTYAEGQHTTT